MTRSWKSSLVALIVGAFALAAPPIIEVAAVCWRAARRVVEFVVSLPAAFATAALSLFAPDGVFALAIARLEATIMTAYRSWRTEPGAGHYKAPGSWTRCAST